MHTGSVDGVAAMATQAKTKPEGSSVEASVEKKTNDLAKEQGKQTTDMIRKAGSVIDTKA